MLVSASRRSALACAAPALLALALASPVLGQTNDEINAGLQFSFSPPGARSLAIGNAFAGRADDATAAYANPAGLLWLTRPEVSVEARHWTYTTKYIDGGSFNGTPTGEGIDVGGPSLTDFDTDVDGLSFVSFVDPHPKWAWAIYRHELANFESDIRSEGTFLTCPQAACVPGNPPGEVRERVQAVIGAVDLDIVNYGVSLAYRFSDNFWGGLGLSYYDFEYDVSTERFKVRGMGRKFLPSDFSEDNLVIRRSQEGSDSDVVGTAGLLWRTADNRWGVGAVYRTAAEFSFGVTTVGRDPEDPDEFFLANSDDVPFETPDAFSFGVTFRPSDPWTLSVEYDRIGYSNLAPKFNVDGRVNQGIHGSTLGDFTVDDADELHFGLEYVVRSRTPVALRAGAWHDPDHQIRYEGNDPFLQSRFQEGDDELHLTGGIGIGSGRFQADLGADVSDRGDIFSLSAIFRF